MCKEEERLSHCQTLLGGGPGTLMTDVVTHASVPDGRYRGCVVVLHIEEEKGEYARKFMCIKLT